MNAGDVKILSVRGRVDANTSEALQDVVLETAHQNQKLLLDLSQVDYMSSAGLRVMLLLHREIHDNEGRVILVGLQERIRDAMQMTGFLKHFAVGSCWVPAGFCGFVSLLAMGSSWVPAGFVGESRYGCLGRGSRKWVRFSDRTWVRDLGPPP